MKAVLLLVSLCSVSGGWVTTQPPDRGLSVLVPYDTGTNELIDQMRGSFCPHSDILPEFSSLACTNPKKRAKRGVFSTLWCWFFTCDKSSEEITADLNKFKTQVVTNQRRILGKIKAQADVVNKAVASIRKSHQNMLQLQQVHTNTTQWLTERLSTLASDTRNALNTMDTNHLSLIDRTLCSIWESVKHQAGMARTMMALALDAVSRNEGTATMMAIVEAQVKVLPDASALEPLLRPLRMMGGDVEWVRLEETEAGVLFGVILPDPDSLIKDDEGGDRRRVISKCGEEGLVTFLKHRPVRLTTSKGAIHYTDTSFRTGCTGDRPKVCLSLSFPDVTGPKSQCSEAYWTGGPLHHCIMLVERTEGDYLVTKGTTSARISGCLSVTSLNVSTQLAPGESMEIPIFTDQEVVVRSPVRGEVFRSVVTKTLAGSLLTVEAPSGEVTLRPAQGISKIPSLPGELHVRDKLETLDDLDGVELIQVEDDLEEYTPLVLSKGMPILTWVLIILLVVALGAGVALWVRMKFFGGAERPPIYTPMSYTNGAYRDTTEQV